MSPRWRGRPVVADLAVTLIVSFAVLGPLLVSGGFWLIGDMVFVPHQPWKGAWVGLDGTFPRAVPMDAVTSLLTHLLPGEVVQRLLLGGGFVVGGLGLGRAVRPFAWYARAAGVVVYLWNPWVLERLLIGQWPSLLGYFLLPWVALAARRLRRDLRSGWAPAGVVLVASGVCSPSSGLTAVGVFAVLALPWRSPAQGSPLRWRTWLVAGGLALVANLTWVVPALLARARAGSPGEAFAVFAARGESPAGLWASLLSLGGIWKSAVVPGERTSAVMVVLAGLLTVAALAGHRLASARLPRGEGRRLLVVAVGALLVAGIPGTGPGGRGLGKLSEHLPGLLLLRDSQRFLGPAALLLAVGVVGAATWCRDQVSPGREAMWGVVGLLAVAPVALLPGLAWGAGGELRGAHYPATWQRVADEVAAHPGATVVLPWLGSYRRFGWAHDLALLDPAPRLLPGEVIVDDRVFLTHRGRSVEIASEDRRVAVVDSALAAGTPAQVRAALVDVGVRWVLVERQPGEVPATPDGRVAVDADGLTLIDLGSANAPPDRSVSDGYRTGYPALVWSGEIAALLLLVASAVWILGEQVTGVTAWGTRDAKSLGGD